MFRPILIATALALAACTTTMDEDEEVVETAVEQPAAETMDLVSMAQASDNLSMFAAAIEAAGFSERLAGPGPFTVFAPTDAAFQSLSENALARIMAPENREQLRVLLAYHVIPGAVTSDQITGRQVSAPTAMGAPLRIDATSGVMVDDANVIAADMRASNGVIHVIDRVLVPQVRPEG